MNARRTPEEENLANQQFQLDQSKAGLADRELAVVSLRMELASFEGVYLRTLGVLYAELDEVTAQNEERIARSTDAPFGTHQAKRAREKADQSRARACSEAAKVPECRLTPQLKRLYREVVIRVHPELTSDLADRQRCEQLLAEARRAFQNCDLAALEKLLGCCEGSLGSVQGGEISDRLARVTRQKAQVRDRLLQIEAEIGEMMQSSLGQLWAKAEVEKIDGRDLLSEMASSLQPQIRAAKNRRY